MKHKVTKAGLLASLGLIASVLTLSGAEAKISPRMLKGVTKTFRKKKEYLSPVFGEASLALVNNMRFYGNLEPGVGKDRREFSRDEALDSHTDVIKILFPSTGGQLADIAQADTNFGRYVVHAKTVSMLVNYADKVREGIDVDERKIGEQILKTLDGFGSVTINEEVKGEIRQILEPLEKKEIKKKERDAIVKNIRKILIGAKYSDYKNLAPDLRDVVPKGTKGTAITAEDFLERMEEAQNIPSKAGISLIKRTILPLLAGIRQSIESEQEEQDTLYPQHTIEHILMAFFTYHFNEAKDIEDLLNTLDDSIINPNERNAYLAEGEHLLEIEDVNNIINTHQATGAPYDVDDFYALSNSEIFFSPTPYKEGEDLVSSGNAHLYDRGQNKLANDTFADCVETTLRHVFNMLLYDKDNKAFDISHLQASKNDSNPYLNNLIEFFENAPPVSANSGDPLIRSQWNRVVGDIEGINYRRTNNNEIASGIFNFINILQKVTGGELEEKPSGKNLEDLKEPSEQALGILFTAINMNKSYEVDLNNLQFIDDELIGNITIKVDEGKHDEYSFDIVVEDGHTYIENYATAINDEKVKLIQSSLQAAEVKAEDDESKEILWLSTDKKDLTKDHVFQPLHSMFQTRLEDNDSKIDFLYTIQANLEGWLTKGKISDHTLLPIQRLLANVLGSLSWDDEYVVKSVSPTLVKLYENETFKETLRQHVGSFTLKEQWPSEELSTWKNLRNLLVGENIIDFGFLNQMTQLKRLDISGNKQLEELNLDGLTDLESLYLGKTGNLKGLTLSNAKSLKMLNLEQSNIQTLHLAGTRNLEELYLRAARNIQELIIEDSESLKIFNLSYSGIERLNLVGNIKNLERLNLLNTKNLQELTLNDAANLKALNISRSSIQMLNLVGNIKNLERLYLAETTQLQDLRLNGATNLRRLLLQDSRIQKLYLSDVDINGIDLGKGVDFNSLKSLTELYIKNCDDITNFARFSNIEKLTLDGIRDLEMIDFSSLKKLKELYITNCGQLNTLDFLDSKIEKLTIENLHSLTKLNLENTKHLEEVVVKNCTFPEEWEPNLTGSKMSSQNIQYLNDED